MPLRAHRRIRRHRPLLIIMANLLNATIHSMLTTTVLRVSLDDGRVLEAVLSPDLRHMRLHERKELPLTVGKCVVAELSPSGERCRITSILD